MSQLAAHKPRCRRTAALTACRPHSLSTATHIDLLVPHQLAGATRPALIPAHNTLQLGNLSAMCMLQGWFDADSLEVTMAQLAILAPAKGVDLPLDINAGAVTPATRYDVHLLALDALHLAGQISAEGAAKGGVRTRQ